jgi:putative membrane protein
MIERVESNKLDISVFILWLFHLSAMIGISMGYLEFFAPKTPLNLMTSSLLLLWVFPSFSVKQWAAVGIMFIVGMVVEILGVNWGWFFGDYTYGDNFGIKVLGVPLLIGVNWAALVLITSTLVSYFKWNIWIKSAIGSCLMILIDWPLEVIAPIFDFWEFYGGIAPLQNYIAWYIIAFFLHLLINTMKIKGNITYAFHLFLAQLFFFTYFAFLFNLK